MHGRRRRQERQAWPARRPAQTEGHVVATWHLKSLPGDFCWQELRAGQPSPRSRGGQDSCPAEANSPRSPEPREGPHSSSDDPRGLGAAPCCVAAVPSSRGPHSRSQCFVIPCGAAARAAIITKREDQQCRWEAERQKLRRGGPWFLQHFTDVHEDYWFSFWPQVGLLSPGQGVGPGGPASVKRILAWNAGPLKPLCSLL